MAKKTLVTATLLLLSVAGSAAETFTVQTSDGVTVHGEIYTGADTPKSAPLILLFHQGGGDSRGEYAPLVPELLAQGYNLIAIDQRVGGDRFEGLNRTAAGIGDTDYTYCDALPDLEAALSYARESGFDGSTVAWGSSYSAALVFRLAVDNPDDISAVLAFSPASGDAMKDCTPERYMRIVEQPVLALRPASEMRIAYVPEQMTLLEERGHETFVADPGTHGSSMLNETRVGAPVDATWKVVMEFLGRSLSGDH
jgi:pimeloyl-ACP methyl ester carboxylesterase